MKAGSDKGRAATGRGRDRGPNRSNHLGGSGCVLGPYTPNLKGVADFAPIRPITRVRGVEEPEARGLGVRTFVCGRREHDRSRSRRPSKRKARRGRRARPEPRRGREAPVEGFSRAHREAGQYRARPTPVSGTCLLRRISGSARLLAGRSSPETSKSGVWR